MESEVTVVCRPADCTIVSRIIGATTGKYKDISGRDVKVSETAYLPYNACPYPNLRDVKTTCRLPSKRVSRKTAPEGLSSLRPPPGSR